MRDIGELLLALWVLVLIRVIPENEEAPPPKEKGKLSVPDPSRLDESEARERERTSWRASCKPF